MRSPSKTICFCRIWGDFIIVIHGVTFESQSPQTRMITDFFLVLSVLNEQHFFNVDSGRGLIKCGSAIVPFVNSFPKNTHLYRLMTTKPSELGNE